MKKMMMKIKYLRGACGFVGIIAYIIGILSVKGFVQAGQGPSNYFLAPFTFSVSDFSLHINSWTDVICSSTLFILLIFIVGFSAIGFIFVLPVVYYKMYALGFTSAIFYWLYGSKGLLYVLLLVPCGVIVFFLMVACGAIAIRFSFHVFNRVFSFGKNKSQYIEPEVNVTFSGYIQSGLIFVVMSFILPLYEGTALPYMFNLISK